MSASHRATPGGPEAAATPVGEVAFSLATGQFNLLISGLSIASSTCRNSPHSTCELIGHPEEYSELSDVIVAQLPGDNGAARRAAERIAVREGRAVRIRPRRGTR